MRVFRPVRLNVSGWFGVTRFLKRSRPLLAGFFFLALPHILAAAEPPAEKNVLFLWSFSRRDTFDSLELLKTVVRSHTPGTVNFEVEYLDSQRFRVPGYESALSQTLTSGYKGKKFDAVVVGAYPALRFAIDHRKQIFPGVPIVFMIVAPDRIAGQKLPPGVTGITIPTDVRGTIELALRLHPDTKDVAIICGDSEFERYWVSATQHELRSHGEGLNVIELPGNPTDRLLERTSKLPPKTIALFELIPSEASQPVVGTFEVLRKVAQQFPTYCVHNYCLDYGAVGGSYPDGEEQIQKGGEIVARILSGESPDRIPIAHGSIDHAKVDWRQLQKWKIPESALPPGSVVLYRQPTLWERDRNYIIAAIVVIAAQGLWIVALLWQRARKRKIDAALKESEGRFQGMANSTPSLVWMCDQEGKVFYLNDRRIEFTGRDPHAGFDDVWTKYVHPDDVGAVQAANAQGMQRQERFSKQYRLRRKDGVYRWMFDVAAPRVTSDGMFAGFIGSAADVTDQIAAQEALEKLSGQLIEAQEKERSRIARDLHDDICQRLALVSMELEQANHNGFPAATKHQLEKIQVQCSEIAGDIQSLSHQLHSSKLEYLGLIAAIKGMCKELAKKHQVSIDFAGQNVPRLPRDRSLCLFRVAQEALNNAIKYSRSLRYCVDVSSEAGNVRLEVRDAGKGFEIEEAKRNGGLGLISMQERVHLVHGEFVVESAPGKGTRIVASVPVASEIAGLSADGSDSKAAGRTGAA
jgi:PAS domain S-box-containing protein